MGQRGIFMKKFIQCLLAISLGLVVLTGCSDKKHGLNPNNPISITIWHYYNGKQLVAFEEMVNQFNQTEGKELGIIATAKSKSTINNLYDELRNAANEEVGADEMPNIFTNYVDFALELDKMGKLVDLDQYFTKKELDTYVDSFIEEGRFDAKNALKVFPTAKSTEVMMVNQTDWNKFAEATGSSLEELQTLEGITECAKKYYEYTDALTPDIADDGKALFGRDSMANYILSGAKELGEEVFKVENGEAVISLTKETAKKLWDNYYIPYINGYFLSKGRFSSDDAKTGDIIVLVGSSSSASYFPSAVIDDDGNSYPIDCTVMKAPYFKDGEAIAVQQGAGMSVSVSDEAHEYASAVFLKWFTQEEQNVEFSVNSSYLPVQKSANNFETITARLQDSEVAMSPVVSDTLKVSVDQVNDYELYTSKAFNNSNDARNALEKSLSDKAKADRQTVLDSSDKKAAISNFDTEENFNNWYEGLLKELNEIINK